MGQIVVPAAARSVITPVAQTTFQVGTYTSLSDTFTKVLDLNDHVSYWLVKVAMPQPEKVYARSSTIRAPGERISNWNYKNRHITLTLHLLYQASTTALVAAARALIDAIENPPYRLAFAPPNVGVLTYADVVAVKHNIPTDAKVILALAISGITIDFEVAPGFSGDRITLQNLVVNPGFEAPSGPSVQVFNDSLATLNAYAVQAGAALTQDKAYYADAVQADAPLRYYRLDEAAGTVAYDAGSAQQNGTYTGGFTLAQAGALTGDSDTAALFNGSSGYVSLPTTGLPSGNGAFTLECWLKIAANPAVAAIAISIYGTTTGSNYVFLGVNTSGHIYGSGGVTNGAAMALNTWYHAALTYDGAGKMTLYVNGAQVAQTTGNTFTVGTTGAQIGALAATDFYGGTLDEVAIYSTALTSTRVSAHYTAGTTTPAVTADTALLASGNRVSFGSPDWGALNQWQVRLRYFSGATATFYLHYTDANNYLAAVVSGTALTLNHVVAGTTHQLATTTLAALVNGAHYWLRVTQFPSASGTQPMVQAALYVDSAGAVSTQVGATVGPVATYDAVTALAGAPQIAASGASLGLGGAFSNVHTVGLFGPGGWTYNGLAGTATAECSGAWDQSTANTYASGPATSYGAARIDVAPAGTIDAYWETYSGGTPGGTSAMPATTGQVIAAQVYAKSSGLSGTANLRLQAREWDTNGSLLRTTVLQTLAGNQAAWVKLSGTVTLGASTQYVSLLAEVIDGTAAASANGIAWFDNAQVYNQTTTGQTVMPYCELRFPQSPAQLLLSGLQGDMAAPALMDYGVYVSPSYAGFTTLALTVGQRATPNAGGRLVYAPALATPGSANNAMALDSTVYGGCYATTVGATNAIETEPLTPTAATLLGLYHEIIWVKPKDTSYATQTIQVGAYELLAAAIGGTTYSSYNGVAQPLGASAAVWNAGDAGMLPLPFSAPIQREDYTLKWYGLYTVVSVNSTSGNPTAVGPTVLLPVDGGVSRVNIGDVYGPIAADAWVWVYNDAPAPSDLSNHSAPTSGGGWRYSEEATPLSNAGHAAGGVGTNADKTITPVADGWLMFDPTNAAGGDGSSISQMAAYLHDQTYGLDGEFPLHVEAHYTPLFLYPREQ